MFGTRLNIFASARQKARSGHDFLKRGSLVGGRASHGASRTSVRLNFFRRLSREVFPETVAQQFGEQSFGGGAIGSKRSRAGGNAVDRADPSRGSQGGSASRTPVWKPWPGMSGQHRNVTRRVSLAQGRPWTGVSWRNLQRPFTATTSRVTSACVAPRYARG